MGGAAPGDDRDDGGDRRVASALLPGPRSEERVSVRASTPPLPATARGAVGAPLRSGLEPRSASRLGSPTSGPAGVLSGSAPRRGDRGADPDGRGSGVRGPSGSQGHRGGGGIVGSAEPPSGLDGRLGYLGRLLGGLAYSLAGRACLTGILGKCLCQ